MDSERKQTHIKIARILRKNFVDEETDELDVVRHLNEAMDLVTDPEERHYSIKLNYQAGVRAKRSKASAIAKQFFIKALNFFRIGEAEGSNLIPLSDDAKETVVKNMIALIQMHSSDFENEAAESLCSEALKLTKSLDDRLQITDMLLPLLSYKLEFNEVLDMAIQSLAAHGMTIPRQEPELGIAYALEREKFEDNMKKPDLLQLVLPNSEKVLSSIGKYIYDALSAADHLGLSDLSNYLAVKVKQNCRDT